MDEKNWDFFCKNSPRLINKSSSIKLTSKLKSMISKINLNNTEKSGIRASKTITTCKFNTTIKAKSAKRPIKKLFPGIPPKIFSREDILKKICTSQNFQSKSPTKFLNNYC